MKNNSILIEFLIILLFLTAIIKCQSNYTQEIGIHPVNQINKITLESNQLQTKNQNQTVPKSYIIHTDLTKDELIKALQYNNNDFLINEQKTVSLEFSEINEKSEIIQLKVNQENSVQKNDKNYFIFFCFIIIIIAVAVGFILMKLIGKLKNEKEKMNYKYNNIELNENLLICNKDE